MVQNTKMLTNTNTNKDTKQDKLPKYRPANTIFSSPDSINPTHTHQNGKTAFIAPLVLPLIPIAVNSNPLWFKTPKY